MFEVDGFMHQQVPSMVSSSSSIAPTPSATRQNKGCQVLCSLEGAAGGQIREAQDEAEEAAVTLSLWLWIGSPDLLEEAARGPK